MALPKPKGIQLEVLDLKPIGHNVVLGTAGSGKTTLLNCISTIDKATSGTIHIGNDDITRMKSDALSKYRREQLGFIFQDFNLLDTFSLRDNIFLPMVLAGKNFEEMNQRLIPIAKKLDSFLYILVTIIFLLFPETEKAG